MTDERPTPLSLWKRMSLDQRLHAARAFWLDEQATDDQLQAVMLIAQRKKFRPKSVLSLDVDRKARHLASLGGVTEALAGRMLIAYHLADERPMMGAFLDALGIAHENGLIEEEAPTPDPAKIGPAAAAIAAVYPAEHVALYLNTLLCQDPDTWGGLAGLSQVGAWGGGQGAGARE
jgi:hypothetical protein